MARRFVERDVRASFTRATQRVSLVKPIYQIFPNISRSQNTLKNLTGALKWQEASWRGTRAVPLGSSGESRTWLVDGDVVTLAGRCERPGGPALGFGVVTGAVLPARPAA